MTKMICTPLKHQIQSAAITANVVIFIAKLGTYLHSGSSAMLAETVHSVVDTFNQVNLQIHSRFATALHKGLTLIGGQALECTWHRHC